MHDLLSFRFLKVPSALCFLALLFLLSGCAGEEESVLEPERPPEELYNEAADMLDKSDYKEASRLFGEVERQHPYSQWATRAQLMSAFALYQEMDFDNAIVALDQFIRQHPGSDQISYAYYLRALCDYDRIADVRRDQSFAKNALSSLQAVISRFPETTYAKDAVLKIALVNDHLAGAEMEIGRHYLTQKLYTGAVGRFKEVIEKYQTTSHVPEALHRLVESYLALGIIKEAKATAAVLGHNFPGSRWYQDSYQLLVDNHVPMDKPDEDQEGSWISRTWKKIF